MGGLRVLPAMVANAPSMLQLTPYRLPLISHRANEHFPSFVHTLSAASQGPVSVADQPELRDADRRGEEGGMGVCVGVGGVKGGHLFILMYSPTPLLPAAGRAFVDTKRSRAANSTRQRQCRTSVHAYTHALTTNPTHNRCSAPPGRPQAVWRAVALEQGIHHGDCAHRAAARDGLDGQPQAAAAAGGLHVLSWRRSCRRWKGGWADDDCPLHYNSAPLVRRY